MELSNEEKAKIFALYLGCDCIDNGAGIKRKLVAIGGIDNGGFCYGKLKNKAHTFASFVSDFKLLLKPLSSITEEDALEVGEMKGDPYIKHRPNKKHLIDYIRKNIDEWQEHSVKIYEYLKQRYYAVTLYPYGKNAFEMGLAIDINTIN